MPIDEDAYRRLEIDLQKVTLDRYIFEKRWTTCQRQNEMLRRILAIARIVNNLNPDPRMTPALSAWDIAAKTYFNFDIKSDITGAQ